MQRITISLPDDVARDLDALLKKRGGRNRSEAVRDLIRQEKAAEAAAEGSGEAVAVVSYVFSHHERQLAARMTNHQHAHAGLVVSVMHVHVDEEDCLEAVFLRGPTKDVMRFAEAAIAEPGVRNGKVNCIPLAAGGHAHSHEHAHQHSLEPSHLRLHAEALPD